jgi:hypothetical protein
LTRDDLLAFGYLHKSTKELKLAMAGLFHFWPLDNSDGLFHFWPDNSAMHYFQRLTLKRGVQARAYVATALRNMIAGPQVPALLEKWFGSSSSTTRASVRWILNGLRDAMGSVEFTNSVRPEDCGTTTYAFVSRGETNDAGKLRVNICPYFFEDGPEQIQTLIHEMTHHPPIGADDVKFNTLFCDSAYGRECGMALARSNTTAALKNADNIGYFVEDVVVSLSKSGV